MPTARDILRRFRPVGTPGPAAPPGVPADRAAELARELQPVFDELAAAQEEAGRIRLEATAEARARRERAAAVAADGVASARRDAAGLRAAATTDALRRAGEEGTAGHAAGQGEAEAVERRAAQRLPAMVERVVAAVRDEVGDRVPSGAP